MSNTPVSADQRQAEPTLDETFSLRMQIAVDLKRRYAGMPANTPWAAIVKRVEDGLRDALPSSPAPDTLDEAVIRADEREAILRLIEGGSFLHDQAPPARFAREVAKAIRAMPPRPLLVATPAATPDTELLNWMQAQRDRHSTPDAPLFWMVDEDGSVRTYTPHFRHLDGYTDVREAVAAAQSRAAEGTGNG